MDINKIIRLYQTLKYLRFNQFYYRLKYKLIPKKRSVFSSNGEFHSLSLKPYPLKKKSLKVNKNNYLFYFLNISHSFLKNKVDWCYKDYGLLWSYNLNYFDWLSQENMSLKTGLKSLSIFYKSVHNNSVGIDPYPTSIRIVNIAKFVVKWNIKKSWLYDEILMDLKMLKKRLEYHLLANHLLENAFALYIGGIVTNKTIYIESGRNLIREQLHEQILKDGMHYERSPMYHCIILEKLLDSLNFAQANNDNFKTFLDHYAAKMVAYALNWLNLDRLPMMQDSVYDVAIPLNKLLMYSKSLLADSYPNSPCLMSNSGYRIIRNKNFRIIFNIGSIGPNYQPGHSHADELNFEFFHYGKPIIVDKGVSTYEKNSIRLLERSTKSHNCLTIDELNSSDVWSGFRVGNRAKVIIEHDKTKTKAYHNGFSGSKVSREILSGESSMSIIDNVVLSNRKNNRKVVGRFHFHPDVKISKIKNGKYNINNSLILKFDSNLSKLNKIKIENYNYAMGFNQLKKAKVIKYPCIDEMKTTIYELS